MQNFQQNSEIMHINNEINLLQDLLKKNEKIQNQFQNGLARIGKIWVKKGQRTNFFQTRKIQNIVKNIFQNKIKEIKKKKKENESMNIQTCKCQNKKEIIWKRTEENSKNAKIFHKINLIKLRKWVINHEMNLSELQK